MDEVGGGRRFRPDNCPKCGTWSLMGRLCEPCFQKHREELLRPREDLKWIGAEVTKEPCIGCGTILTREQRVEAEKAGFSYNSPVCPDCREDGPRYCNLCGEEVSPQCLEEARVRGYHTPICVACAEREGVSW